jgi:hypothetical protein
VIEFLRGERKGDLWLRDRFISYYDPLNFQGYKEKLIDIREEILRKRRAGKLPGDTTSTLKAWWQSHSKWPYPTVSPHMQMT